MLTVTLSIRKLAHTHTYTSMPPLLFYTICHVANCCWTKSGITAVWDSSHSYIWFLGCVWLSLWCAGIVVTRWGRIVVTRCARKVVTRWGAIHHLATRHCSSLVCRHTVISGQSSPVVDGVSTHRCRGHWPRRTLSFMWPVALVVEQSPVLKTGLRAVYRCFVGRGSLLIWNAMKGMACFRGFTLVVCDRTNIAMSSRSIQG